LKITADRHTGELGIEELFLQNLGKREAYLLVGLQIHPYEGGSTPVCIAHTKLNDLQEGNAEQGIKSEAPKCLANALTVGIANTLVQASFSLLLKKNCVYNMQNRNSLFHNATYTKSSQTHWHLV